MVSKCANPDCSRVFKYLHEGQLYVSPVTSANHGPRQFYWLCSECARKMTLVRNSEGGLRPEVRKKRGLQCVEAGSTSHAPRTGTKADVA